VRFGKYTHLRNKDRIVQVYVNGEACSLGSAAVSLPFLATYAEPVISPLALSLSPSDELVPFSMQLGAYGQAYFTVESSGSGKLTMFA